MTPAATFTYNASGGLCAAAVLDHIRSRGFWPFVRREHLDFCVGHHIRLAGEVYAQQGEGTQCGCGER